MDASPTKRRALATLDVNANSPASPGLNKTSRLNAAKASSQLHTCKKPAAEGSPSPSSKRALAIAEEGDENSDPLQHAGAPPAKRACISAATSTAPSTAPSSPSPRRAAPAVTTSTKAVADSPSAATTTPRKQQEEERAATATPEQERQSSHSPEKASPVFDNSQLENSQLTTVTEPDHPSPSPQQQQQPQSQEETSPVVAAARASLQHASPSQSQPPLTRPRALSSLTREQARQKAEILRLRLGLARYKVRTGQTDVPLERLQRRPVPGSAPTTAQSSPAQPQSQQRQQQSAPSSFSSPISTTKQYQSQSQSQQQPPVPAAQRRLSREDSSGNERTTPRKALPSGRSTSQTPIQQQKQKAHSNNGDYTPSASQESSTPQQSRPRYGAAATASASTPDREALQRLAASAALDASRRIEEAAEGGRRSSSG